MTITTKKAEECARGQDAIKESSQFPGYRSIAERAGTTIRSLAAERDALQKRVAELEGALLTAKQHFVADEPLKAFVEICAALTGGKE